MPTSSASLKPRLVRIVVFGSIALLLVLAGLFVAAFTVGVPDVLASAQQRWVMSDLQSHPSRSELEVTLNRIGADWHAGKPFQKGEAYSAFGLEKHCERACDNALQIAFTHTILICAMTGDVVTVMFDRDHRVSSWSVMSAFDGC
jgi:hypothetical protein